MNSTVLSFYQFFFKDNMDWPILYFDLNLLRRQYGLNGIVFWLEFSEKTIWVEPYYLSVKIFLKRLWIEPYFLLIKFPIRAIWAEMYCLLMKTSNKEDMGWTVLCFDQNFPKIYELNRLILWLKFSWKTVWVERHCLLVKISE